MDLKFQWHSFEFVAYLINRLPTSPDYQFLKTFRCACYPYLSPYNKHKLLHPMSLCIFLGYNSAHRGYKCLHFSGRVYIARTVNFDQSRFPYLQLFTSSPTFSSPTYSSLRPFQNDVLPHSSSIQFLSSTLLPTSPILSFTPSPSFNASNNLSSSSLSPNTSPSPLPITRNASPHLLTAAPLCSVHLMWTWAKSGIFKPKIYSLTKCPEPNTISAALLAPQWKKAMEMEYITPLLK